MARAAAATAAVVLQSIDALTGEATLNPEALFVAGRGNRVSYADETHDRLRIDTYSSQYGRHDKINTGSWLVTPWGCRMIGEHCSKGVADRA